MPVECTMHSNVWTISLFQCHHEVGLAKKSV